MPSWANFLHYIPPLPGQWKWKDFFLSRPWGIWGNKGAGQMTSRVRVIWTPCPPAMPTPMSLLSCDLFPFVSSSPGVENRNHHLSTEAPWAQKTFYSLLSLTYVSCLITSAALFWEIIFLVLNNSWPRSNSNRPPTHFAGYLLPWGQFPSKNLLVILIASFCCRLWDPSARGCLFLSRV